LLSVNRVLSAAAAFLALALAAGPVAAAPDEEALGKSEGYPLCPLSSMIPVEQKCIVGMLSHFDTLVPARKVDKGATASELKRAAQAPKISYSYQKKERDTDAFLEGTRTTGLLVLKGDTILVERYQYDRKPEQRMLSMSMAKTIVAMLVGVALSEGDVQSLDDRAEKYVVELKGTPYGETPIRHLLTMSSGVRFTETYSGSDDVATLARLSVLGESDGGAATVMPFGTRDRPPGERFSYSSAETQVLGLVLRAATGKPLAEYLSEKIWQPLGAEADASWTIDRGGFETAYFGVNATVRDYARLGMLLANGGALGGRQIIPAGWVRAATTPPAKQFQPGQASPFFGYGYQTWILPGKERQFMLRGLRGQGVFVDPKSKIVMVHTAAGNVGDSGMGERIALWSGVVKSLTKSRGKSAS
jgi:CubicO group peptidase (beta-lactamase class C family)